jgi:lysine 2,3-aminomutase
MAAKYKGPNRPEPGQEGLTALLDGEQMFIKNEGYDAIHDRHGTQHRLKDEAKWKPLGIGSGEEEKKAEAEEKKDGE